MKICDIILWYNTFWEKISLKILSFYAGGFAANTYFVSDDDEKSGVIVDPAITPEKFFSQFSYPVEITAILLTHAHFDHMLTLDEWREKTKAPLFLSEKEAGALSDPQRTLFQVFCGEHKTFFPAERLLRDGDSIAVGSSSLTVMTLPGHTEGSLAFIGDGFVLTGDTMFAFGDVGRVDFPTGDGAALMRSIRRLCMLDGEYTVYPGHGPKTELCKEAVLHGIARNK